MWSKEVFPLRALRLCVKPAFFSPERTNLMRHNELSGIVIDCAIDIHRRLGPGLLESVYQEVLLYELRKRGLRVEKELPIPVIWDEVKLEVGFRADLIVENLLIVELKSHDDEHVSEGALSYINRLSDFLFVASRWVNAKTTGDVLWVPGKTR